LIDRETGAVGCCLCFQVGGGKKRDALGELGPRCAAALMASELGVDDCRSGEVWSPS